MGSSQLYWHINLSYSSREHTTRLLKHFNSNLLVRHFFSLDHKSSILETIGCAQMKEQCGPNQNGFSTIRTQNDWYNIALFSITKLLLCFFSDSTTSLFFSVRQDQLYKVVEILANLVNHQGFSTIYTQINRYDISLLLDHVYYFVLFFP